MQNLNKILLIEDNQIVSRITKAILLKELNCQEVDIAETGKAALELVDQKIYDLILMDIGLPDTDGCTVTKAIRSNPSNPNSQVAIIGVTAHAEDEEKEKFLEVGMNRVIIKPLTDIVVRSLRRDVV